MIVSHDLQLLHCPCCIQRNFDNSCSHACRDECNASRSVQLSQRPLLLLPLQLTAPGPAPAALVPPPTNPFPTGPLALSSTAAKPSPPSSRAAAAAAAAAATAANSTAAAAANRSQDLLRMRMGVYVLLQLTTPLGKPLTWACFCARCCICCHSRCRWSSFCRFSRCSCSYRCLHSSYSCSSSSCTQGDRFQHTTLQQHKTALVQVSARSRSTDSRNPPWHVSRLCCLLCLA